MNWKKTTAFFAWQSIKYAQNWAHFRKSWSYYKKWKALLADDQNSLNNQLAWLSFEAIDYLDQYLKPEHRVFEYGGGGSTLFFLNRAGSVATVENNDVWVQLLKSEIAPNSNKNWQVFAIKGTAVAGQEEKDPADPDAFATNNPTERHLNYEQYARCIEQFPKGYFDVVLVDGRARPSCLKCAIQYVKPNGLLIMDNMERKYYWTYFSETIKGDFKQIMSRTSPLPFHPNFCNTTILRKTAKS